MIDNTHELDRARRTVRSNYAASLMSSTKWREVLTVLSAMDPAIRQILVKFVDANMPKPMQLPWLSAPHDFVDSLEVGPFPLVSIEWMVIPSIARFAKPNNAPAEEHVQDLTVVRAALERLGKKLPLENSSAGLKIVGHIASRTAATDR